MQATLQVQAAAPTAVAAPRSHQRRCMASAASIHTHQRAEPTPALRRAAATGQRNVAAHAKGAIKPMEATFTDFKLVDPSDKVGQEAAATAAAKPPLPGSGSSRPSSLASGWWADVCAA